jgi:hypothetical protein
MWRCGREATLLQNIGLKMFSELRRRRAVGGSGQVSTNRKGAKKEQNWCKERGEYRRDPELVELRSMIVRDFFSSIDSLL